MTNYSNQPNYCRVDFFKETGKWYATESVRFDDDLYNVYTKDVFHESLHRHFGGNPRFVGMTAVCLEPYIEHSHPLSIIVEEKPSKVVCDCGKEYDRPYSLLICHCGSTICGSCGDIDLQKCNKCLKSFRDAAKEAEVCPSCDRELQTMEQIKYCESCDKEFKAKFCRKCGYDLQDKCDECLGKEFREEVTDD